MIPMRHTHTVEKRGGWQEKLLLFFYDESSVLGKFTFLYHETTVLAFKFN